ncbi:restriction endonuclease subunit S [uncultured Brachyspira sp.]|uniref:restriction endonuclease subunit S n=1 Tax=uncultured Brachyspira sp. TaxID=221953 RepID=UPI002626A780|nr:restriction endonuclease subunit S [uncultured Brachyspira sp.]
MKNTHLPTGWQEAKLRDILFISSKKYDPQKNKTNYKCIELEHIESDTGILKGYINSNDQLSIKNIFENGDILYGKLRPYLRKFHNAKFNGVCSSEIWVLKGKKVINEFLYYFIQSYKFDHIANISCGTKMPRADWSYMSEINFIIPPLEEQKRIAEVLSLCDDIIENLTELIEKKEQYKKGVMQRLLSGEVRFKEFTDEWQKYKLLDIGISYSGLTNKNASNFIDNCNAKYVTYKSIYDSNKIDINRLEDVFVEKDEKQNLVQYGDAFFTISSETPDEVAISSVLLDKVDNTYLNSFCFGFRFDFNILLPEFARYYFRSNYIRKYTYKLSQGSTRFNLSKNKFLEMIINIPSIEEQKKIAGLLSVIDEEIENLKKQLELRKQQKKGLMQKLLTGEVRI